jgi:flagellar hook-associated protein 3 FlgL
LSDDPRAAASAVVEHSELGAVESYSRAGDSTTSRLTVVDTALSDIVTQLTAAKSTAASVRGSITTGSQRAAAVVELQGIKQALVGDFSTAYRGAYVFSGTETSTAPYTLTGTTVSAYQGDAGSVSIDIDRRIAVPVTFNGDAIARGSDTNSVFTEIDSLITAIQNGDAAGIDAGVAALNRAFDRATGAQTAVGISLNRLEDQAARLADLKTNVRARLSSLEDADLAEAITALEAAQTAKQATLGVVSIISRQTLMDYLK